MSSNTNTTTNHPQPPPPPPIVTVETSSSTNTTFVQADPSNFRVVVQKLTGSTTVPPPHSRRLSGDMGGSHMSSFKLHERRQAMAMRKLEMIKLGGHHHGHGAGLSSSNGLEWASPVSTLDGLGRGISSPSTPVVSEEEENAIIAEKGFYLHPISPLSTSRECEPKLLPLFPLHSPKDCD